MRDIPGHILGFFLFLVVTYYAYAFVLGLSKNGNGAIAYDMAKGFGFALIYMMMLVWLPAAVATLAYYFLFRARWWAVLTLAVATAALLYTVTQTGLLDARLQLALFVWCGLAAALAHHAAILFMRLFVRAR